MKDAPPVPFPNGVHVVLEDPFSYPTPGVPVPVMLLAPTARVLTVQRLDSDRVRVWYENAVKTGDVHHAALLAIDVEMAT